MLQKKCLKGDQTGKGEGRDMVQAAEEGCIKVEGQGWRKRDKNLKERHGRDKHCHLQHLAMTTHAVHNNGFIMTLNTLTHTLILLNIKLANHKEIVALKMFVIQSCLGAYILSLKHQTV